MRASKRVAHLELDIRQAIADGAFELHYQPSLISEANGLPAAKLCCAGTIRPRHDIPRRVSFGRGKRPA